MPEMTTTTGAVLIPEIWLNEIRRSLEERLFSVNLFKTFKHEGQPGDILHVPDVSDITANDMLETGKVTPQAITETEFTININKWKEASFRIKKILAIQSNVDSRTEYTKKAGFALAKQMEIDLFNLFDVAFSGFNANGTAELDGGAAITLAGLTKAKETLDLYNVPQSERVILTPPEGMNTLLQIAGFTSIDFVNSKPTVDGIIPRILGMPVLMSNLLPSRTITASKKQIIVAHKEAVVTAVQKNISFQSEFQVEHLATLVVADTIYGVKQFRTTNAVRLRLNV